MYDGVTTHGLVHHLRMEEVFWGRLRILLKVVDLVLVALPPPTSDQHGEIIKRAWRELNDAVYVGRRQSREDRDREMMKIMRREADKNYELTPLEEG